MEGRRASANANDGGVEGIPRGDVKEGGRGWAGGAGSLADYVAGWSGERNPGEDAVLRRAAGRMVGGVESARRRPVLAAAG